MLRYLALALLPAAALALALTPPPAEELEDARLYLEQNVTDGDMELVGLALGPDDGLRKLDVFNPDGKRVGGFKASKKTLGFREFLFESPEPAPDLVLAAYPEGTYTLKGTGMDGTKFLSEVELSHAMPAAPVVTSPLDGDRAVDLDTLVIQWEAVPEATHYVLEVDQELDDFELELRILLPASTTSFTPPAGWLQAGIEASTSVFTVGANGNVSATEVSFTGV
jgi:hypothetical protein